MSLFNKKRKPNIEDSSREHVVKPRFDDEKTGKEPVKKRSDPPKDDHPKSSISRTIVIPQPEPQKTVDEMDDFELEEHVSRKRMRGANRRAHRTLAILKKTFIIILCIALTAGVAFAFAYYFCRIQEVDVEGNKVYTDDEIAAYVLDDAYSWNAVYVMLKNFFVPEQDIPLVDSATVYMNGLHKITISVTEKDYRCVVALPQTSCASLDYIREIEQTETEAKEQRKAEETERQKLQEDFDLAVAEGTVKVDAQGNVIDDAGNPVDTGGDVLTWFASQTASDSTTDPDASAESSDISPAEGTEAETGYVSDETAETETAEAETAETATADEETSDGEQDEGTVYTEPMYAYIDAEGNVLDIIDRYVELPELYPEDAADLVAGGKISEDEEVIDLYTSIVEKLSTLDTGFSMIIITKDDEAYLIHERIAVNLGDSDEIAQKMRRIDYIFPYIEGRSGILHMENWTQSNTDIIFQIFE